jgi:hypothetical protein
MNHLGADARIAIVLSRLMHNQSDSDPADDTETAAVHSVGERESLFSGAASAFSDNATSAFDPYPLVQQRAQASSRSRAQPQRHSQRPQAPRHHQQLPAVAPSSAPLGSAALSTTAKQGHDSSLLLLPDSPTVVDAFAEPGQRTAVLHPRSTAVPEPTHRRAMSADTKTRTQK